jgi:hypothetical protein
MSRIAIGKLAQLLAIALIVATAAATHIPAPWRMDATNDEMIHVTNYQDDYNKGKFLHELKVRLHSIDHRLTATQRQKIKEIYYRVYFLPRLQFLFLRDAHPPLFPLLAELVNCIPDPGLLALRLMSVAVSLAFIFCMYLVGKEYADSTLGLWLAGMATVGLTSRIYAGLGRPYVYGQALAAVVIWVFLRRQRNPEAPLRRFLGVLLLAQATDWMLWPMIAPLLVAAVAARYKAVASVKALLREGWWYCLASLLLLFQFGLQIANPVISNQVLSRGSGAFWKGYSLAAPFAELSSIAPICTSIGAILFTLACLFGIVRIFYNRVRGNAERYALAAALLATLAVIAAEPTNVRFYIVPMAVLIFYAGVGVTALLPSRPYSDLALSGVMLVFLVLAIVHPEDPYARVFDYETRYSAVAARVSAELKPGDVWFSYPDFIANPLYLYGAPAPREVPDSTSMDAAVLECGRRGNCIVFAKIPQLLHGAWMLTTGQGSSEFWTFSNQYGLARIPQQAKPLPQAR